MRKKPLPILHSKISLVPFQHRFFLVVPPYRERNKTGITFASFSPHSQIQGISGAEGNRVVVIGGGIGGSLLAKHLQHHAQVTLIDPKEYFRVPWASLRGMVDPMFGERSLINFKELLPNVNLVVSGAATITSSEVITTLGFKVPYDYLVVATGHEDHSPASKDERIFQFREAQEVITLSRSVLIVGGGPTGVEFAGEIATAYPNKKITLVHRGSRVLEFIGLKASKKAHDWLVSKNVEIILDQSVNLNSLAEGRIETSSGRVISADCHFDCTGKPISSLWLKGSILGDKMDAQGRLLVDGHLRVRGFKNVFAIGDITSVPELKQGLYAMRQAELAAKNLKMLMAGQDETRLATYKPGPPVALVSLGKQDAVGQVFCFTVSGRIPGFVKSRDLFLERTRRRYGI